MTAAASLIVALATACSEETPPDPNGNQSGMCTHDDDCPNHHRCEQGVCEAYEVPECELTGCEPHHFCDTDGHCRSSGEKPCGSDADCGEGFFCPESIGYCLESCLVNTDCDYGLTCNPELRGCVECTFDPDCQDSDRPHCLSDEGRCVECLAAGHCETGFHCDLSEESDRIHTCREGCLDGNDCLPGTRCERPGDAPGRCVECSVETAAQDCRDATRQRCHPDLLMCVMCFRHDHCTVPALNWCHQEEWFCVQCLQHDHCQRGTMCVSETSSCEVGCNSDERCPPPEAPERVHCDTLRGEHGECVECLDDEHCDLGYKCDDGDCVEGCDGDHNCPAHKPRCDLMADRCVECLDHPDCAPNRECDLTENACTCKTTGDACSSSAECGNPPIWPDPYWDGECLGHILCVSQLKCDDSVDQWTGMTPSSRCGDACTVVDRRSTCPSGYCCRRVRDTEGEQRLNCVPDAQCPGSNCRN